MALQYERGQELLETLLSGIHSISFFWYSYLISFWRTTLLYMLSRWTSKWNWLRYYVDHGPEQSEHSIAFTNIIDSGDSIRDWDFTRTSLEENLILSHWTWACETLWAILPSQSIIPFEMEPHTGGVRTEIKRVSIRTLDMPIARLPWTFQLQLLFMPFLPSLPEGGIQPLAKDILPNINTL